MQERAKAHLSELNTSLNGTIWTTPAETGPGGDEYALLDAHQPNLIQGVLADIQEYGDVDRVTATTNYWGNCRKPEIDLTQIPIAIQAKNLSFDHLELPFLQIPRVLLDGASLIAEALASEALSAETSDLIRYSTRRAILAASTAALGEVFRPYRKTLEKLKLHPENPLLKQARKALQEFKRWDRRITKHRRRAKFGINLTIRDAPLILKNSKLLKIPGIKEDTVWWSGYDARAWRTISNHQSEKSSKLSQSVKKLKKEVARLKKRNEILNNCVYWKGEAVESCGIPFPNASDDPDGNQSAQKSKLR